MSNDDECPSGGDHYWVDTGTNLVCDYCGAERG